MQKVELKLQIHLRRFALTTCDRCSSATISKKLQQQKFCCSMTLISYVGCISTVVKLLDWHNFRCYMTYQLLHMSAEITVH